MTDKESDALWERYDIENIGSIPLPLLLRRIMPKDYTRKPWNVERDEEFDATLTRKKRVRDNPVLESMPPSLEKVKWNMDKIVSHIQQKIVERTKRASDQYREAFALFGSPAHGITPSMFKKILEKLGFVLTPEEITELFRRFDTDGSGNISFQELVMKVMPADYPEQPWNAKRSDAMLEETIAKKRNRFQPAMKEWPKALACNRMSMSEVEAQIQQKIVERTKRASDQYREAFQLFGSPAHGITPSMFKRQLEKLGMVLSDGEIRALFKKYDGDGSGNISFQELVTAVMPPDYPRKPWNVVRDEEMDAALVSSKTHLFKPVEERWPSAMNKNKWTREQIQSAIYRKIVERTKRASDQYREAFQLFGSPADGISRKAFKWHLQQLGLVLSQEEVDDLFDLYDSDGSGAISFQELVHRVMPHDYTETSWYIKREDQNEKLREMSKLEMVEDSPFGRRRPSTSSRHSLARGGAGGSRGPLRSSSVAKLSSRPPLSKRSATAGLGIMQAKHKALLTARSKSSGAMDPLRTVRSKALARTEPRVATIPLERVTDPRGARERDGADIDTGVRSKRRDHRESRHRSSHRHSHRDSHRSSADRDRSHRRRRHKRRERAVE